MGGYASRTGPADGVLDDLYCRVVLLSQGGTTLALIAYDLLYVPARLVASVAAEVAHLLGTSRENVLVSATHTHCGPALAGPGTDELLRDLTGAALRCAAAAQHDRTRVRLVRAEFSVAGLVHHRRNPPGEVDDTGTVLIAVSSEQGEVVASIVSMACHPTVLEGDTVGYSRDYPGVVCDTVETLCGGRAIFLQGFAGDTNPVFHDHSPEDMRLFGRQVGTRVADAVLSTRRAARENWTINLSRGQSVPVTPPAPGHAVDLTGLHGQFHDVFVEAKPRAEREAIHTALSEARRAVAEAATPSQRDAAAALEAQWWIEEIVADNPPYLGIDLPPPGASTLAAQVLTIGDGLRIVALPGEPLHGAAVELRARLGDGLILVGYAHAAASYLPCIEDYPHQGYEIGSARYQPGTVERLVDAAVALCTDPTDVSS